MLIKENNKFLSEFKQKKEQQERELINNVKEKINKKEKYRIENLSKIEKLKGENSILDSSPKEKKNDSIDFTTKNKTIKAIEFDKYSKRKNNFILNTESNVLTYLETETNLNNK